jgi:hypothetical protein
MHRIPTGGSRRVWSPPDSSPLSARVLIVGHSPCFELALAVLFDAGSVTISEDFSFDKLENQTPAFDHAPEVCGECLQ